MRTDLDSKIMELRLAVHATQTAIQGGGFVTQSPREALDWLVTVQLRAAELSALLIVDVVDRQADKVAELPSVHTGETGKSIDASRCCLRGPMCDRCRFLGNRCKGYPNNE